MNWYFPTNNKGIDVHVHVNAKNACEIQMHTNCLDSDVVFNLRREKIKQGKQTIIMKVPFSPQNTIVNVVGSIPNNINVAVTTTPCNSYQIPIGKTQTEFIEFAQAFAWAVMNGKLKPSDEIYKSSNGNFKFVLLPKIVNYYGRAIGSPASVDGDKKVIICDYELITHYTLAGMIALLCHEYAHVFANEKEGYAASSEEAADKFGLRLFLAAGYGESEYLNALKQTFKRVDTSENRRRMQLIVDHAKQINKGLIYGTPY
jgi:hypothetical protein